MTNDGEDVSGVFPIYRFVVAHLVPGLLALWPLYILFEPITALVDSLLSPQGTVVQGMVAGGIALAVGLILDGLCFVTLDYGVSVLRRRLFRQKDAKRAPEEREDFEFIDRIYAMNYSWKQLYCSASLVLLCVAGLELFGYSQIGWLHAVVPAAVALILFVAAARSASNCEQLLAAKWGTK